MDKLDKDFKAAKKLYDGGSNPLVQLWEITLYCLRKLSDEATSREQGKIDNKRYYVYEAKGGISRPYFRDLFITSEDHFTRTWDLIIKNIDSKKHLINFPPNGIDSVLYTSSMAFAMCYDIWKNSSRKTPGTYLEVLLGSLMGMILPDYKRTKHVPLPIKNVEEGSEDNNEESVSTDIVFEKKMQTGEVFGLVIPVKITTRERIVQPFAHQRILDGVFGPARFNSILICISEMQLDKKNNKVNEICVPGTIRLFQKYLAQLVGIFYFDPPVRYLQDDVREVILIGSVGELFTNHLPKLSKGQTEQVVP
jgi:hypothetical protein